MATNGKNLVRFVTSAGIVHTNEPQFLFVAVRGAEAGDEAIDVIRGLCAVYWRSCRAHSAELAAIFQASMSSERFALRWRGIRSDARSNIAAGIRAVGEADR